MIDRDDLEALKIDALATGLRAAPGALARLAGDATLTTREYPTTGGLACRVGDVYLNAPFDEWFCEDATIELDVVDGTPVLRRGARTHVINEVFPVPDYAGALDPAGRAYDEVVFSHLDRIRISPISGCAHDCGFCDLPGRITLQPLDRLVEATEMALQDPRLTIRHILISGGSPGLRQSAAFADTLVRLIEHFAAPDLEIDVMMSSGPETPELVDRLADAGVYGLSLNMELFSADASLLHLQSKDRRARPFLEETVRRAVTRLGSEGRVRSLIIPGLEPSRATLDGVRLVADLGADPVLSPFRPSEGTRLARQSPCDPDELRRVLDGAREIVASAGVALGPRCLPCQHNTLAFPWDVSRAA